MGVVQILLQGILGGPMHVYCSGQTCHNRMLVYSVSPGN